MIQVHEITPLDLPGHCLGPSKNWTFPVTVMVLLKNGPYGPQGPWAQPLFDCVGVPSGGFFCTKGV